MTDVIEALVGYLFVVGGRAVSATPPGAAVEQPPRRPTRGRELDTLYVLISPNGPTGGAALYEQLVRLAAEVYFRSGGSVTSALREAINAVNSQLTETNRIGGTRYAVNMACAVMREQEVYLARAGAGVFLLRQAEAFSTYPDDLAEMAHTPLGQTANVDIRLARCEIAPGHVLILCDAALARAGRDPLAAALTAPTLPALVEALKPHAGRDAQALIIQFTTADTPNPAPPPPRKSTPVPHSIQAAAVVPDPTVEPPAAPPEIPTVTAPPATEIMPDGTPVPAAPLPVADALPAVPDAPDSAPIPAPRVSTPASKQATPAADKPTPIKRAALGIGNALDGIGKGIGRALDRMLPEAEESSPRIPTMLAAVLAILVPVIVVFVVVALQLSQFDLTQFEQTVREVEEAARAAEVIPLEDEQAARTAWLGVIQRVDFVEESSGRTGDPTLIRIRARAQAVLDRFDKVTRRTPITLRNYGQNARLVGPVIRGGTDVYILDTNRSAVFRDTLNSESKTLITRNTQPVIQQGQAVGAFSVRTLIDIIWMAEGGVQRANVLAALDSQGILVTYSPTFSPATAQRLAGSDLWERPIAMATWRGNLYLLDVGAGQIWRYRPVGNAYPNPPEAYFEGDDKPDLTGATDFGIDSTGNVYILFSDGTLKRYTSGVEQRFALNGLPTGSLKSGVGLYVDSDSPLPAIYILDAADQAVYQVTLSGAFRYRLRATDPSLFKALTSVYAEKDDVYVTSGGGLYHFSLADLVAQQTP